jgi:hypothetical protein
LYRYTEAAAADPMSRLTAEEQIALGKALKQSALDNHEGCLGLAGVGRRQERAGWFLTLFRSKWSGAGHAALMELMFLPGLQACFASMVGLYKWNPVKMPGFNP